MDFRVENSTFSLSDKYINNGSHLTQRRTAPVSWVEVIYQ